MLQTSVGANLNWRIQNVVEKQTRLIEVWNCAKRWQCMFHINGDVRCFIKKAFVRFFCWGKYFKIDLIFIGKSRRLVVGKKIMTCARILGVFQEYIS